MMVLPWKGGIKQLKSWILVHVVSQVDLYLGKFGGLRIEICQCGWQSSSQLGRVLQDGKDWGSAGQPAKWDWRWGMEAAAQMESFLVGLFGTWILFFHVLELSQLANIFQRVETTNQLHFLAIDRGITWHCLGRWNGDCSRVLKPLSCSLWWSWFTYWSKKSSLNPTTLWETNITTDNPWCKSWVNEDQSTSINYLDLAMFNSKL